MDRTLTQGVRERDGGTTGKLCHQVIIVFSVGLPCVGSLTHADQVLPRNSKVSDMRVKSCHV